MVLLFGFLTGIGILVFLRLMTTVAMIWKINGEDVLPEMVILVCLILLVL
jgi:hypothetical protein